WYVTQAAGCAGGVVDANGDVLCPMGVDSVATDGTSITAHFTTCPTNGPWPIAVVNPDGQTSYFYSVEVTPSSDGHLNQGAFEAVSAELATPRWKHAATYGFDVFAHAYLYVAGGQDAAGGVLGSVEKSELDIFGVPGPFAATEQFLDAANPRVT